MNVQFQILEKLTDFFRDNNPFAHFHMHLKDKFEADKNPRLAFRVMDRSEVDKKKLTVKRAFPIKELMSRSSATYQELRRTRDYRDEREGQLHLGILRYRRSRVRDCGQRHQHPLRLRSQAELENDEIHRSKHLSDGLPTTVPLRRT